jgi:hypothetical protein
MDFKLRECSACSGIPGKWNEICGGCGGWILVAEVNGERYAGPLDASGLQVAPWVGRPSPAAVATEMARLAAPFAITS